MFINMTYCIVHRRNILLVDGISNISSQQRRSHCRIILKDFVSKWRRLVGARVFEVLRKFDSSMKSNKALKRFNIAKKELKESYLLNNVWGSLTQTDSSTNNEYVAPKIHTIYFPSSFELKHKFQLDSNSWTGRTRSTTGSRPQGNLTVRVFDTG